MILVIETSELDPDFWYYYARAVGIISEKDYVMLRKTKKIKKAHQIEI